MSTVQAVFNPMICSWHFSWHWCRLHLQAIIIKGFYVLVYNRVGVTGTGWQCLATAGISAEGKRTFR